MGRVNDHSPFFNLFEDEAPITLFFFNCDKGSFGSLDVLIGSEQRLYLFKCFGFVGNSPSRYTLTEPQIEIPGKREVDVKTGELIKAQYGAIDVAILC